VRDCNNCGKCCTRYGGGALATSDEEIDRWETDRPDIAAYVKRGKIWFSPVTGKQMSRCPWLRKQPGQDKFLCRIYYDRPDDCRHYPVTVEQMIIDECEMLDARDLVDLKKAQRKLDDLMADIRPAVSR
jgi:Fe-S-cluster containining protein